MTDKELMQQALRALEWHLEKGAWGADIEGVTAALRERLAQPDAKRILVMRGQKDKVVAIYRENDVEILRTEIKKEDLLSVWMKEKNHV